MGTELHAIAGPCIEMSGSVDGSAGPVRGTDGPVLLECRRSDDGGLVGTGGLENIVVRSIDGDGSLLRGSA